MKEVPKQFKTLLLLAPVNTVVWTFFFNSFRYLLRILKMMYFI